ncbi:F-box/kelch-repeat protein At3g06240-like [Silene latifolia]|uniref:F-box/kelch-repeat protein At3g06240-like n=1 Tax=Silene latifolia TaxID=37657 RepID=UPI003D773E57
MVSSRTIPDEIILEILLRLPVKSILRFNTLSKHYYSLIRSQFFIDRHLDLVRLTNRLNDRLIESPMQHYLRLFNRRSSPRFRSLESSSCLHNIYSKLEIIGPIDGLYCVVDRNSELLGRGISLWNPATSEEYILPLLPATAKHFVYPCRLGCGFGYDQETNSYKIVTIYPSFLNMNKSMLSMYVFDVSERTWRYYNEEHHDILPSSIITFGGVFFHGACHWIGSPIRLTVDPFPIYKILALDMSMESSRVISLPDVEVTFARSNLSIVTLNGCLALIHSPEYAINEIISFSVWVMAEYGGVESWSMMYRVSLPHGIVGRSLGIFGNRFYVGEGEEGWIASYDLDSKDVERYGLCCSICSFLPYEESLVRIISS